MSPSILALLLHIGSVLKTIKDIEAGVADVVKGKASAADAQAVLADLAALLSSGIFNIPGLSGDQLTAVIGQLTAAL
jgi:hypothetical protein